MTSDNGSATPGSSTITQDDIEAKFREIKGDIDTTADSAKSMAVTVGAVVGVVVVIAAFWFGSRRGKKKTTIVEVRRF